MDNKKLEELLFDEIETAFCGYHSYSEIYPSHIVQSAKNASVCIIKTLEEHGYEIKKKSKKPTKVRVNGK